jgi:hypothetical protein
MEHISTVKVTKTIILLVILVVTFLRHVPLFSVKIGVQQLEDKPDIVCIAHAYVVHC